MPLLRNVLGRLPHVMKKPIRIVCPLPGIQYVLHANSTQKTAVLTLIFNTVWRISSCYTASACKHYVYPQVHTKLEGLLKQYSHARLLHCRSLRLSLRRVHKMTQDIPLCCVHASDHKILVGNAILIQRNARVLRRLVNQD